jgi:hypothetical protein
MMKYAWQHKRLRDEPVVVGSTKFETDGHGFLRPQPDEQTARFLASHPNYRLTAVVGGGEEAVAPVPEAPPPEASGRAADDLEGLEYYKLLAVAKHEGVELEGRKTEDVISAIRAHRAAATEQ